MRIAILLLVGALALAEVGPAAPHSAGPCTGDTTAVHHRRTEVVGFLGFEDHSVSGLPFRPAEPSILVVTDSATCAVGLTALNALGGDPEQSVLVLDLAGSGWAIVGSTLLDDTADYFTREWQYLFTLHGGG